MMTAHLHKHGGEKNYKGIRGVDVVPGLLEFMSRRLGAG